MKCKIQDDFSVLTRNAAPGQHLMFELFVGPAAFSGSRI